MKKRILTVTLNPAIDHTIEIPDFKTDAVNRVLNSRKDAGGKGINVATALSSEFKVDCTGFLGKDNSELFKKHFTLNNLNDHFIYVNGKTREGIKIADSKNQITTDINFDGFNLSSRDLDLFINNFKTIIPNYSYLILSGSIPSTIPSNIYALLAAEAKKYNIFVVVDSSREPLMKAINSKSVDLIKPNIDELFEIYPNKDIENILNIVKGKVPFIALTLGEKGSRIYNKDKVISASAPKIKVLSTVGAGDTYLAGFIASLYKNLTLEECLITASSWAASKLTQYGSGLSNKNPPHKYKDQIEIKKELV